MAKGVKSENEEKKIGFIREVFGLAVILFTVLCLICLITGDMLFYTPGLAVRNFFLGVFGIYAYVVIIHLGALGVMLVSGKGAIPKSLLMPVFLVHGLVACVLLIVHIATFFDGSLAFGEEISKAYNAPFISGTSVGGALASLLILPVSMLISKVGAIILYVVIFIVFAAYLFRKQLAYLFNGGAKKTGGAKADKTKKKDKKADTGEDSSDEKPEYQVENFFFNEKSGFAFRTKREMTESKRRLPQPFSGRFETKTIVDVARQEIYGKAKTPSRDRRGETPVRADASSTYETPERRETFAPDRGMKSGSPFNGSPMYFTKEQNPQAERQTGYSEYDNLSYGKDVYTIPVKGNYGDAQRRDDNYSDGGSAYGGGRGGLFDGQRENNTRYNQTGYDGDRSVASPYGARTDGASGGYNNGVNGYAERVTDVRNVSDKSRVSRPQGDDIAPTYSSEPEVFTPATESDEYYEPVPFGKPASAPTDRAPSTRTPSTRAPAMPVTPAMPATPVAPATPAPGESRVKTAIQPRDDFAYDDEPDTEGGYSFIPQMPLNYKYTRPRLDLLRDYSPDADAQWAERNRQDFCKQKIIAVFKQKGIDVTVENVVSGSTVTRYEISVPDDVSLSDVKACKNDLAFRLKTRGEFNMESIPGTDLVGIEIASEARRTVGMRSVFSHKATKNQQFDKGIVFMLGEDVLGTPVYLDLVKLPHLLICGATGTGKSVCLNTMLVSLMYNYGPDELRFIIVDPKRVEFKAFEGIPHLVFDSILGFDDSGKASKAIGVLEWTIQEMERRYNFLAELGYKNIKEYNRSIDPKVDKKIPYLIILIDEFADFIMAAPECKKNIDNAIGRIAQKARAAGITLILATQRPSAEIMSGNIKTNIPSRICFKTASSIDSRVVLDDGRAEKLLSMGDCLYKTSYDSTLKRAQGAFIDTDELKEVVRFIKEHNKCYFDNSILDRINKVAARVDQPEVDDEDLPAPKASSGGRMSLDPADADEVDKRSLRVAIKLGHISTSLLRTYLRIGYNRANSIVIWMERMGYITSPLENQKRDTIMTREQYEQLYGEFVEDF